MSSMESESSRAWNSSRRLVCKTPSSISGISLVSGMTAAVMRNPSLHRGVRQGVLLRGFCRCLRTGPVDGASRADALYAKSFAVPRLDSFLSHSWHGSGVGKALALLCHFHGVYACVVAAFMSALVLLLQATNVLQPAFAAHHSELLQLIAAESPTPVPTHLGATATYALTYLAVLLFWQDVLDLWSSAQRSIFLDKLCIHQSDAKRKKAGIKSIGAYLQSALNLLVLWDETYLQRAWCVFELAVFHALNPSGKLLFVPVRLGAMELLGAIVWAGAMLVMCVVHGAGVVSAVVLLLRDWGIADSLVVPITIPLLLWPMMTAFLFVMRLAARDRQRVKRQLQGFSVEAADCYSFADKSFILAVVQELFETTERFDDIVATELRLMLDAGQGATMYLTYGQVLRMSLPIFMTLGLEVGLCDFFGAESDHKWKWILGWLIHWALHIPCLVKFFEWLSTKISMERTIREEMLVCSCLGAGACALTGLWAASWSFTLSSVPALIVAGLLGFVLLLLAFGRQLMDIGSTRAEVQRRPSSVATSLPKARPKALERVQSESSTLDRASTGEENGSGGTVLTPRGSQISRL